MRVSTPYRIAALSIRAGVDLIGNNKALKKPVGNLLQVHVSPGNSQSVRNFRACRMHDFGRRNPRFKRPVEKETMGARRIFTYSIVMGHNALFQVAICYEGLNFHCEPGSPEDSALWSHPVKEKILTAYLFYAASYAIIFSCVAISSRVFKAMEPKPWRTLWNDTVPKRRSVLVVYLITTFFVVRPLVNRILQTWDIEDKRVWFVLGMHIGFYWGYMYHLGMYFLKPVLLAFGVGAGLFMTTACAPSEKFVMENGPLAMGNGAIFTYLIGKMLLPKTYGIRANLMCFIFPMIFAYLHLSHIERVIKRAENASENETLDSLDPFKESRPRPIFRPLFFKCLIELLRIFWIIN